MKKNCFYVLMAAAWMAVSCTNNEIPTQLSSDQAITIVASVSSQSRTPQLNPDGSGSFEEGDVMTLCIAKPESDNVSMDYAYQKDVVTWGGLNLLESASQVEIAACYPKQTVGQDGTFTFDVLTASEKDLLLAPAQAVQVGTANAVNLNFRHALHRLNLTFTPGNGYSAEDLQNLSCALTAKNQCVVDAFKGEIKDVKTETGKNTVTGNTASFYVIPQATSGITLDIAVGGQNRTLVLSDLLQQLSNPQEELKGGAKCEITLKVNRDGIVVEGGSIGAWEDQVTVEGDLTIG